MGRSRVRWRYDTLHAIIENAHSQLISTLWSCSLGGYLQVLGVSISDGEYVTEAKTIETCRLLKFSMSHLSLSMLQNTLYHFPLRLPLNFLRMSQ